jgi:hypothetical protein
MPKRNNALQLRTLDAIAEYKLVNSNHNLDGTYVNMNQNKSRNSQVCESNTGNGAPQRMSSGRLPQIGEQNDH